jgi:hypothetical protein
MEAWNFLLRKELKLRAEEPRWLDLPAMMRMVVTTPNVFKHQRPEWLGPFNFVLFPLVSMLGGFPAGYDNSTFLFIVPYESDRRKWKSLTGVNLADGQRFQIAMRSTANRDRVIPDTFRIVLHNYLGKPEVKSLAPDGTPCTGATQGLLLRAKIIAGKLIPLGKETDRRWEQGEDPSMLDFHRREFRTSATMAVANVPDQCRWKKIGIRNLIRKSKLSQKTVYAILNRQPVRASTFATFRRAIDS